MSIQPGQPAPDFTLNATDGSSVTLSALKGKPVVLFFYPKDDTPGCTIEACAFRDDHTKFQEAGAEVFGISRDDAASHQAFTDKFNLNFPLLVDEGGRVATAYGVIQDGRFVRSTFLIGADGNVAKVWQPVDVNGHSAEVYAAVTG